MQFSVSGWQQFNVGKVNLKRQVRSIDRKLLYLILGLTGLGLIAVADASAPQALNVFADKYYFVKQQAIWGVLGLILMFVVSRIKPAFWERIATPLFIASVVLLVIVLIPGIGAKALGARRWFILGPISIQPSELIKLSLAIYLAKVASRGKGVLSYFLPVGVVAALVMAQPDFGTTLIIVGMAFTQIFVSGVNLLYIAGSAILGFGVGFLYAVSSVYRKARLLTFFAQSQDPLGRDYHIRQILLALGSGGIFGVGLGQSRQKFLFLPEAATDSIFAIVAEEMGFIGALALVVLFALFIFRGISVAKFAPDTFSKVLATGIVAWIGGQAILNMGSMVSLFPLTGIPLPFFSYGGSSLTTILIACGILLGISRTTNERK